jgi:hypothetical protein
MWQVVSYRGSPDRWVPTPFHRSHNRRDQIERREHAIVDELLQAQT